MGEAEREVVRGSKEKISREDGPDFATTTKCAFSGRRIHVAYVTVPWPGASTTSISSWLQIEIWGKYREVYEDFFVNGASTWKPRELWSYIRICELNINIVLNPMLVGQFMQNSLINHILVNLWCNQYNSIINTNFPSKNKNK